MRGDIGTDDPRVRVRRGRKGKKTRRRSKDRVDYSAAPIAMVTAVDRGRYTVRLDEHDLRCVKARELTRGSVIVGDRVRCVGDLSGRPDTLGRIVAVEPRRTELTRSSEDTPQAARERPMVANVDLMLIVSALAAPEPRPRMIDRCLVAAYAAGITPVLVATKADLAPAEPLLRHFAGLDLECLSTRLGEGGCEGIDALAERIRGHTSVLVGHSGVGKSTLTNALIPHADRATGAVNAVTGRGRHTSTGAVALRMDESTWLVDTPGIRSFGLAHIDTEALLAGFPDLAQAAESCPRRCSHLSDAPDCGLDAWAATARDRARLDSFRRLALTKSLALAPWEIR